MTQTIGSGQCFNCGWMRSAILNNGRVVFSAFHSGGVDRDAPKLCHECRIWTDMGALVIPVQGND